MIAQDIYDDILFSYDTCSEQIKKKREYLKVDKSVVLEESKPYNVGDKAAPINNGRFFADIASAHFECFFHLGTKDELYVMLSGSRTRDGGKGMMPLPNFSRWSWYSYMDGSLLCIDDPMFYKFPDCKVGWYYGSEDEDYREYCGMLISDIAEKLGVPTSKIILYGSSGGGTAAIGVSKYLDGCQVVAIAPQLDISEYEYLDCKFSAEFENVTGIDLKREDKYKRNEYCQIIKQHKYNRYTIFYNVQSTGDVTVQLPQLCEAFDIKPHYGAEQSGNLVLWIYDAVGAPQAHSSFENQSLFRAINLELGRIKNGEDIGQLREQILIINELWRERYDLLYSRLSCSARLDEAYAEKSEINAKLQQTYAEKSEINAKLKQTYAEKSELNAKLQQSYADKTEINAKLKQAYADKSEINAKLKQTYADKSEINAKLKQAYADKSEINAKLKQAYADKSEINAKLKQAYADKSEINAKLKQAYADKSEINAKLKQTYAEKSEINAKLKQAYADKSERGIIIKDLKAGLERRDAELGDMRTELDRSRDLMMERDERIGKQDEQIANLRTDAAEREALVSRLREQIERCDKESDRLHQELAKRDESMKMMSVKLEDKDTAISIHKEQIAELESRLEKCKTSLSYRIGMFITYIPRRLAGLFGRSTP